MSKRPQSKKKSSLRAVMARAGMAIIIAVAVVSQISMYREIKFDPRQIGKDPITRYERRLEPLKKALPPAGAVGYITDTEVEDIRFAGEMTAIFYLTQYALAPVVVDYGLKHPLVVGNFNVPHERKFFAEKGLAVLQDFGNGVMLLEREGS